MTITSNMELHNTYGGNICLSDFYTNYAGTDNDNQTAYSVIAQKIAASMAFDKECGDKTKNRDKNRKVEGTKNVKI